MASSFKGKASASFHGIGSSPPCDSSLCASETSINPSRGGGNFLPSIFLGHRWSSNVSPRKLENARNNFNIPNSMILRAPLQGPRVVDVRGMVVFVAFYLTMFTMRLHFPFLQLVCDLLDVLGLAPAQLVPNA